MAMKKHNVMQKYLIRLNKAKTNVKQKLLLAIRSAQLNYKYGSMKNHINGCKLVRKKISTIDSKWLKVA